MARHRTGRVKAGVAALLAVAAVVCWFVVVPGPGDYVGTWRSGAWLEDMNGEGAWGELRIEADGSCTRVWYRPQVSDSRSHHTSVDVCPWCAKGGRLVLDHGEDEFGPIFTVYALVEHGRAICCVATSLDGEPYPVHDREAGRLYWRQ